MSLLRSHKKIVFIVLTIVVVPILLFAFWYLLPAHQVIPLSDTITKIDIGTYADARNISITEGDSPNIRIIGPRNLLHSRHQDIIEQSNDTLSVNDQTSCAEFMPCLPYIINNNMVRYEITVSELKDVNIVGHNVEINNITGDTLDVALHSSCTAKLNQINVSELTLNAKSIDLTLNGSAQKLILLARGGGQSKVVTSPVVDASQFIVDTIDLTASHSIVVAEAQAALNYSLEKRARLYYVHNDSVITAETDKGIVEAIDKSDVEEKINELQAPLKELQAMGLEC